MKGHLFTRLFPSASSPFSRPALVMQLAEVSKQTSPSVWTRLPWRWGGEQSSMCVCVCVYSSSYFLLPPFLPSGLAFFNSVPSPALASHDHQFAAPRCAVKRSEEEKGRVRWRETGWGWNVFLVKAERHCVHKSIASEVKAQLSQAAVCTCPLSLQSERVEGCCPLMLLHCIGLGFFDWRCSECIYFIFAFLTEWDLKMWLTEPFSSP